MFVLRRKRINNSMEFITIAKNGRTKRISKRAWEEFMPSNKDGWSVKPDEPKELKEKEPLKVISNDVTDEGEPDPGVISDVKPDEPKGNGLNFNKPNNNKYEGKK